MTKEVTVYLYHKLRKSLPENYSLYLEQETPPQIKFSFSRNDQYKRLSLRRRNSVWKWTDEIKGQTKRCLSLGECTNIRHHHEIASRFYQDTTQQEEFFKPDMTVYCAAQSTIMFLEFSEVVKLLQKGHESNSQS